MILLTFFLIFRCLGGIDGGEEKNEGQEKSKHKESVKLHFRLSLGNIRRLRIKISGSRKDVYATGIPKWRLIYTAQKEWD